jgi:hypothetical protein
MAPLKKIDYGVMFKNSSMPIKFHLLWIRNPNMTVKHITHQNVNFDFLTSMDAKTSTNLFPLILEMKQINLLTHTQIRRINSLKLDHIKMTTPRAFNIFFSTTLFSLSKTLISFNAHSRHIPFHSYKTCQTIAGYLQCFVC